MGRLAFSRPIVRAAFCAFLLLLPLSTAWNLTVGRAYASLLLRVCPGRSIWIA